MDDSSRLTRFPSSTTIKQSITTNESTTPAPQEKNIQTGISSAKDAFEVKKVDTLFTANPNTGELKFGSGVEGKRPPLGNTNITPSFNPSGKLLQETKSEITNYLKDGNATASSEFAQPFPAMKQYLISAQNEKIDSQMQEAGKKADIAMQQATTGMITGIASGLVSIGGAVDNMKQMASEAKKNLTPINSAAIEARYQHFTSSLNDFEKALEPLKTPERKSDAIARKINADEQAINQAQAENSDNSSKAHRDKIRDAILDFITKMRDVDPKI